MVSNNSIEWMTPIPNNYREQHAKCKQEIADAFSQNRVLSGHIYPHLQVPKITDPGWLPVKIDIARMTLDPGRDRLIDAMVDCLKRNTETKNGEAN